MSAEPIPFNRQIGRFRKARGTSKIDVQRGETLISTVFEKFLSRFIGQNCTGAVTILDTRFHSKLFQPPSGPSCCA